MKGLSMLQPWASLVAIGAKRIETRSRRTNYRGPLLICASKGCNPTQIEVAQSEPFLSALRDEGVDPTIFGAPCYGGLPLGYALAVATLDDCLTTEAVLLLGLPERESAFGDYSQGRFGWFLSEVRPLPEPIPCKGALGLWDVPEDVARRVREQVEP